MNNRVRELITPISNQYLPTREMYDELVREVAKTSPIWSPVALNIQTVKDIANTAFTVSAVKNREDILKGGWEQLLGGAELNEGMLELSKNPSLLLYTQLIIELVTPMLMASEEQPDSLPVPS